MVERTHGGEHQQHAGEPVELREQDGEDQEHRGAEGLHQEGAGLLALLVLALHLEGDALAEIGGVQRVEHRRLDDGRLHAFRHVGGDGDDARAVDAVDQPDLRGRRAGDEIADRHRAGRGVDGQLVERVEAPPLLREAHQDVDRLVGRGGPVFGDLHPVGDELDRRADRDRAGAVFRRLGLVDVERPVDAGKRQAVIHVARCRDCRERSRRHSGRPDRAGRD